MNPLPKERRCFKCRQTLPIDCFGRKYAGIDTIRQSHCKECGKLVNKEWRQKLVARLRAEAEQAENGGQ